jgi:hypothetical protein
LEFETNRSSKQAETAAEVESLVYLSFTILRIKYARPSHKWMKEESERDTPKGYRFNVRLPRDFTARMSQKMTYRVKDTHQQHADFDARFAPAVIDVPEPDVYVHVHACAPVYLARVGG